MASVTVRLPERMRKWVDAQVKAGGYADAGEYVRDLIRKHREERGRDVIDALLVEGLDSGPPIVATDRYWAEKERRARGRAAEKAKRRA